MFAMFSDIYYYFDKKTIDLVEVYCTETGNDWAATFYDPKMWKKFQQWKENREKA